MRTPPCSPRLCHADGTTVSRNVRKPFSSRSRDVQQVRCRKGVPQFEIAGTGGKPPECGQNHCRKASSVGHHTRPGASMTKRLNPGLLNTLRDTLRQIEETEGISHDDPTWRQLKGLHSAGDC